MSWLKRLISPESEIEDDDRIQVTLLMTPDQDTLLTRMQWLSGVKDRTQLFRRALGLLECALNAESRGYQICAIRDDGYIVQRFHGISEKI
jgi:hypothetical protein